MTRLKGLMAVIAAAGLLGFMIGNALAAEGQNPFEKAMEDRFNAMDTNKDGKISYEEYEASYRQSIKSSFERRDLNKDGFLSKEEFMPKMGQGGQPGAANPFQQVIPQKTAPQPADKPAAAPKPAEQTK